MSKRVFLSLVASLLLVLGLLPLLFMLFGSVSVDGHFSLSAYSDLLTSAHTLTLLKNSLLLASLVTLLTLVAGVPLGLLFSKTDFPFRAAFVALFTIPLLLPPYIIAIAWSEFLPPRGPLTTLFFGLGGNVLVLFTAFLPVPMILTIVFLRTINPRLEESAQLLTGWSKILREITLPLIAPGILLSGILVFLLSVGEFSVSNYLRYPVFPVESFTQFSAFYDFKAATAAATPLGLIALVLLIIEAVFLHKKTGQMQPYGDHTAQLRIKLGRRRPWIFAFTALAGATLVLLPLGGILVQSGSAAAWVEALQRAGDSLLRSLIYAVFGGAILSILGFFTAYLIHTKALPFWRGLDSLTLFVFALPSTVIGIGLISLWNTPWTMFIYATPLIIIVGYLAKYTVLTSRITLVRLAQLPPSMEEAAQLAGAGWFRIMTQITAPLARRSILGAAIVGYIFSLRDTGITMLVYPPGYETLPVRIFTLMANGSAELIAALCVLMMIATLVPPALFWVIALRMQEERFQ